MAAHQNHPLGRILGQATAAVALCTAFGCAGGGETGSIGGGGAPGIQIVPIDDIDLSFVVSNDQSIARRETVLVSVPFSEGQVADLGGWQVDGQDTEWLVLQRWAGGSIRVAQAQFTVDIPADTDLTMTVVRGGSSQSSFAPHPWVAAAESGRTIGAQVHDTFNHRYEAEVTGSGETLQETGLKRVRRWRTFHETTTSGGIGRDFLSSTFYVSDFRDMPFVMVDWVIGNDYLGADDPQGSSDPNLHVLGPVDVNDVSFFVDGVTETKAFRPDWHAVSSATTDGAGRELFEVMDADWLADGQTRRYRFMLRFEDPGADASERQAWDQRFDAFAAGGPVKALAGQEAWSLTEGSGLLGGPGLAGPSDAASRADTEYNSWLGDSDNFGRWGAFGDTRFSHATGTPRNAPLGEEWAHALQSGDLRLLTILEQKAWAQSQRPYHMYDLEVGAEQLIMLFDGVPVPISNRNARDFGGETLGRRALKASDPWASYRTRVEDDGRPHGWNPYDYQHWSTDLHFENWTLTGDEWCREELRQLGQCLKGTMRLTEEYLTSNVRSIRAEAWTMQSFVQVYLATRDESVKTYALRRAGEIVDRDRIKDHESLALALGAGDSRTRFPIDQNVTPYLWYAPWQMPFVIYGYLAGYRFFESDLCLLIAEACAQSINYATVTDYTSPVSGQFRAWGMRYSCIVSIEGQNVPANHFDNEPGYEIEFAGGTLRPIASAAAMLSRWTTNGTVAQMAAELSDNVVGTPGDRDRWDKWVYLKREPVPETDTEE